MIIWRDAVVVAQGRSWTGAMELTAEITAGPAAPATIAPGAQVRALAYPALVGAPRVGDRVLLTCSALARGLGTGGYALVAALPDALPTDPPAGPGHLVKARYTPLQPMVLGVDEQESAEHDLLRQAEDLGGMPVVVADLHSALPAIVAGARAEAVAAGRPLPRVGYVMSDGGALPAWFSRTIAGLRQAQWLAGTVTVGQAFGGDLEAVTLHTGLLALRHVLKADLAVVIQGPGNLGTGTRWGFSGVAAGEAVNAAGALAGRPVAALRVSGADPRPRHRGVSHHSLTAYGRVALAPADVVVPAGDSQVAEQSAVLGVGGGGRHRLVRVATTDLLAALGDSPVALSTMGRGLAEDPAPFLAAAAAGRWAERLTHPVAGPVYHLALAADWERAVAVGRYEVSTRGRHLGEVGFIHASLAGQVDGVAGAIYSDLSSGDGPNGGMLIEIDPEALRDLGTEVVLEPGDPDAQTGERFPHLYGPVPLSAVRAVHPWRGRIAATLP